MRASRKKEQGWLLLFLHIIKNQAIPEGMA